MVRPQATTGNPHSSHMHGTSTTTNKKTLDRVARRVVIEQELPDPRTALKRAQESLLRQDTATTATNSATSISSCPHDDDAAAAACSHILEFLPLQLNLELAAAATGGWIWQHPVHALHLHSQEERWTGREPPLLYGEEQERAQALQMRGFAGQWVEDKYTDDWKDLHQMEAKAKVLADIKAASEARIAMENQLVAANKIERERMQKEKQASATASTSTAVTTTDQKPAPVEMESQPEKKKPALPSSLSSAATKPSSEAAFDKSTMDPKESKEETKEAAVRNLETKKVEGLVALAKSEAQQGPSKTTEEPLKLQKPASTPGEVGKPPSVPSTSTAQSRALEVNKEENSLPSMSSAAVGPTSSMTSSALSVAASASSRPAVSEMKLSPSFLRPGTATTPGTSVASAASRSQPTIDPPLLDESRFWSLQAKENQIETVRRQFLARRSAPPPKRAKASVAATKKRKSSSVDHKTPSLAHLPAWKEHAPNTPKLSLPEERDWYARQKHVSERVQVWLEQFRWSRELYWQEQQTAFRKAFGSMESTVRTCPQCQNTDGKDDCWFVPTPSTPCTGDDLMQCLECSFVGCAPVTRSGETANHMWQHQLTSNHKFGT